MISRIMITADSIEQFKQYLKSGRWEDDFDCRTPDGQAEMLDMLEALFELSDIADEILTRKLYKNMRGDSAVSTVQDDAAQVHPGSKL